MASVVFFLRCERIPHRTQSADLLADNHRFFAELLKMVKLGNFTLRLAQCRRGRKSLGDRLARHLSRQPMIGTMAGIIRFGAVAGGFSALAGSRCNRAPPKVAETGDPAQNLGFLFFERGKSV